MRYARSWFPGLLFGAVTVCLIAGAGGRSGRQVADTAKAFRDSVTTRQKLIAAGREVFHGEGTCFACHGAKLEGTAIAPTLRAHKWRNGDGSFEMILRVVHTGVPNTAMVAHPGNINETEIPQGAAWGGGVSGGPPPP